MMQGYDQNVPMVADQQPPPNAGFAAHPRVVQAKPKFKDPYGIG